MRRSMSSRGNCQGNSPTELFLNSLKSEREHGTRYRLHRDAAADLFESIETFYSGNSCHSSLGFVSLTLFLRDRLNAQQAKETAG
jgi:transposase InsO family protein